MDIFSQLDYAQLRKTIQRDLGEFLRKNGKSDLLKNFDYEGSNTSIITNILAYHEAFYALLGNLIFQECFLDSATQRGNVISSARLLGYVPQSPRASQAILYVTDPTMESGETQVLPAGTTFETQVYDADGRKVTATFTTNEPFAFGVPDPADPTVMLEKTAVVKAFQGTWGNERHNVLFDYDNGISKVLLDAVDIDTTFTQVNINSGTEETGTPYVRMDNFDLSDANIDSNAPIFFIEENTRGVYEVKFGDNFFGRKPPLGSFASVSVFHTLGQIGNNLVAQPNGNFKFTTTNPNYIVNCLESSFGGADVQSIASIKKFAPDFAISNKRLITQTDFESFLGVRYPDGSFSVWDGNRKDIDSLTQAD
jgi:hypothetical protein